MVSLSIDPPPSSRRASSSRPGLLGLSFVAVLAVGLAAGFWLGRITAPGARAGRFATAEKPMAAPAPAPAVDPAPTATAIPTATPAAPTPPAPGQTALPAASPTAAAPGAAPVPAAPSKDGPRRLSVTIRGPLEDSIASALPKDDRARAEELTAVVNRILVWDLHVSRDARKGDTLELLWTPPVPAAPGLPPNGDPVVLALRYGSSKLGAVLAAYRYQPQGARWPRYYRADGREVEARLVDTPVAEYEQITSLLKDGRRHKGVDFKAPVGSPVLAPFDGVIERRNWHFASNGNCLDLVDPKTGRHAIFLHLDVVPRDMGVGRKVRRGEVIAASGNSGRSFAPHLHYQLEDASGKVLDPFEALQSERRALPVAEKATFEAERARLDAALAAG